MVLTSAQSSALEKIRQPGSSAQAIKLTDDHVRALIYIAARDVGLQGLPAPSSEVPELFDEQLGIDFVLDGANPRELFGVALGLNPELETYVGCLASIHKARLKYRNVLATQPFPTMEQVAPRALLQFNQLEERSLAALLVWRKWLYDLDNRAAQDTGYLFEPVVSAALGGISYSAKNSPIRRRGDATKGRQVDCVIDNRAYEIKIRVTIAASGQGRWKEEMIFPEEAQAAGFTPVLVVLDPTDNPKLAELVRSYEAAGGEAYLGDAAWAHLRETASDEMAVFLEKYVHLPLDAVVDSLGDAEALPEMHLSDRVSEVIFRIGDETWAVPRKVHRGNADEE